MVCSDGVLLYADTEFTLSTMKIQRAKQWVALTFDPNRLRLAAAIAGDEDYARLTLHQMTKGIEMAAGRQPIRLQHVVDALSAALLMYMNARAIGQVADATFRQALADGGKGHDDRGQTTR
jgi:hypothetical protein